MMARKALISLALGNLAVNGEQEIKNMHALNDGRDCYRGLGVCAYAISL